MAAAYATMTQLKEAMPDVQWGAVYDTAGAVLLERASRNIDAYLKRAPGAFAVTEETTRYFNGSGGPALWIAELADEPDEVAVAENLDYDNYVVYPSSYYFLWPDDAADLGEPYTRLDLGLCCGPKLFWWRGRRTVKVTGLFGFSQTPPEEIVQATIILAVKWFKRGQQAFADTGAISDLARLTYTKKLDPDVELILSHPKFQRIAF